MASICFFFLNIVNHYIISIDEFHVVLFVNDINVVMMHSNGILNVDR